MYQDDDPIETSEWLDALESLIENEGVERAKYILERLSERASRDGTELPYSITTPFRNSIPVTQESRMPGDLFMERRIRSLIRWNAMAMVVRANKRPGDLGGHSAERGPPSRRGHRHFRPREPSTAILAGTMSPLGKESTWS